MSTDTTLPPSGAKPAPTTHPAPSRRTVDAPTRVFHWLLAISFLGAWVTSDAEPWRPLHVTLGYTVGGLLVFRLLYGLVGPRPVRLASLWRRVSGLKDWLAKLAQAWRAGGGAPTGAWRQGANLAIGLGILAVLALITPLVLSGYGTFQEWGATWGGDDALADLHEFFGNALGLAVLVHIGLIAAFSLARRQNLARPMWSGRQLGAGPDLLPHNRVWLAVLLVAAVLGFWGWQHTQFPNGLLPTGAGAWGLDWDHHDDDHHERRGRRDHHHDDDDD